MKSLAILFCGVLCSSSVAAIVNTSGAVQMIGPPADVSLGQLESNTGILAFVERQNAALAHDVVADVTVPGTSPGASDLNLSTGTIATGTLVDSYYLHFDPVGVPSAAVVRNGSVTFDTDILGIFVLIDSLAASNSDLGFPGTIYGNQPVDLGVDADVVVLGDDRRTVSFHLGTGPSADNLRIVTIGSVPEPATAGLLLTMGTAMFVRRRSRGCKRSLGPS